jgi:hypothetical protein
MSVAVRVLILAVVAAIALWFSQMRVRTDLSPYGVQKSGRHWRIASVIAFLPAIPLLYVLWGVLERLGV